MPIADNMTCQTASAADTRPLVCSLGNKDMIRGRTSAIRAGHITRVTAMQPTWRIGASADRLPYPSQIYTTQPPRNTRSVAFRSELNHGPLRRYDVLSITAGRCVWKVRPDTRGRAQLSHPFHRTPFCQFRSVEPEYLVELV